MRVLPPAAAGPLLPWLLTALAPMPRTRVKQLLRFGQVTVNGVPVDENAYLKLPNGETRASGDPFDIVVPEDSLWVLGDNPRARRFYELAGWSLDGDSREIHIFGFDVAEVRYSKRL